jgi:hypothetical protein
VPPDMQVNKLRNADIFGGNEEYADEEDEEDM